jgi:NAD(P)-dependent dehydrogenase (short-subunit alcohol dehydrogenase family)
MSLHPRVAIVTGGGRGIGRAMALGLAEAGARVIVSAAREREEIEDVANEAGRRLARGALSPKSRTSRAMTIARASSPLRSIASAGSTFWSTTPAGA